MEFIETSLFLKLSKQYLSEEELRQLQTILSVHPDMGTLIQGSGGLRKIRWFSGGKGKKGGVRVIYYWITQDHQIILLTLYKKSIKDDLTSQELKYLRTLIEEDNDE